MVIPRNPSESYEFTSDSKKSTSGLGCGFALALALACDPYELRGIRLASHQALSGITLELPRIT